MKPTSVPAVLKELKRTFSTHPDLANDQVLRGPELSGNYRSTVLILGYSPTEGADVTVALPDPFDIVPNYEERFDIGFLISSVDGANDYDRALDEASRVLAVMSKTFAEDSTFKQTCGVLRLTAVSWWEIPTLQGAEVNLRGTITGKALL